MAVCEAKPVLAQIKALLDDAQFKVPPKSPLGTVVFYSLNHWDALNIYLQDGRLEIDNNKSERSIKPFVIGRKNWMFHGNDVGAAYEYAYWAKDTNMCRKLEPYMDEDTKIDMLKRCENIGEFGLTYEQHGVSRNSKGDLGKPMEPEYGPGFR